MGRKPAHCVQRVGGRVRSQKAIPRRRCVDRILKLELERGIWTEDTEEGGLEGVAD